MARMTSSSSPVNNNKRMGVIDFRTTQTCKHPSATPDRLSRIEIDAMADQTRKVIASRR